MRVIPTVLLLTTALALVNLATATADERKKPAPLPERPGLKVLVLDGTPHQRGLVHGRTMKAQIHEIVRLWKAQLADAFKMDADAFIRRFVRQTDFLPAIKKWTPDLLDEIRGMADGAGIDFDTMLVLQLPDECFINGSAIAGNRCSSLGFGKSAGRPAMVAQNMDVPSFADGFQLVLHVKEAHSDLEAFVLTQAGCIGLNGLNNRAIGICCNALWQLSSSRDGLPVACIVRGVLQQRTEEDAVAFLHKIKHASGQNYLLGGPAHAYGFECSAKRIGRFQPNGRDDAVWHTNHPLVNDDYTAQYRALRSRPMEPGRARSKYASSPALFGESVERGSGGARRRPRQSDPGIEGFHGLSD
jgi:isopenicillin-N N-acyltransferase like protein